MVISRADRHTSGFRGTFREIGPTAAMAWRIRSNTVQPLRPQENESLTRWDSSAYAGASHD